MNCARDPALAAAFVRYNLTEDGQKLWGLRTEKGSVNSSTLYHYPILPAIHEEFSSDLAISENPFTIDLGRHVDLGQSRAQLSALEPGQSCHRSPQYESDQVLDEWTQRMRTRYQQVADQVH
ncbi:MAG: hypothetical protein J5J06_07190 [Phycisphaerae bacterium]|nr:hypothetical protein [Phycisphaerae bacterium]